MQVIAKRSLHFRNPKKRGDNLIVKLSSNLQAVPDWIRNTPEFKIASENHDIIEVEPKIPVGESKKATKADDDDANGMTGSAAGDDGGKKDKKEKKDEK